MSRSTKNLIFLCLMVTALCASILTGWAIEGGPTPGAVFAATFFAWAMALLLLFLLSQAYKNGGGK